MELLKGCANAGADNRNNFWEMLSQPTAHSWNKSSRLCVVIPSSCVSNWKTKLLTRNGQISIQAGCPDYWLIIIRVLQILYIPLNLGQYVFPKVQKFNCLPWKSRSYPLDIGNVM